MSADLIEQITALARQALDRAADLMAEQEATIAELRAALATADAAGFARGVEAALAKAEGSPARSRPIGRRARR